MAEVGAFEAKNTLGGLLDRVEKGEEIVITRRGRPVARLAPLRQGSNRTESIAAAERLLKSRDATLGGVTLRELIDEGRR